MLVFAVDDIEQRQTLGVSIDVASKELLGPAMEGVGIATNMRSDKTVLHLPER